jgi:hypothetical protein
MSLRERVEAKNSIDGELAPAQGGGSFGSLVCFVVELSKHMKKVDFMKGVRELQHFLGVLPKVRLIWQRVRGQSLD